MISVMVFVFYYRSLKTMTNVLYFNMNIESRGVYVSAHLE